MEHWVKTANILECTGLRKKTNVQTSLKSIFFQRIESLEKGANSYKF